MILLTPDDTLSERIRECVLELLVERGPRRSICPSEVAHLLAMRLECSWQELMRPVRTIATELADGGVIEILQHDMPVDIREVRGPVRLRLRTLFGNRSNGPN